MQIDNELVDASLSIVCWNLENPSPRTNLIYYIYKERTTQIMDVGL